MEILVIGGTGTMGKPLVTQLYNDGHHVYVVCRKEINDRRKIYYFFGDAKDKTFMKRVLSKTYDVIVDFCMYSAQEFYERYEMLLNTCHHYVCLSSSAVYANIDEPKKEDSPRYMESDPPQKGNEKYFWYCYEKARIEDILHKSNYNNWTIIRPGMTMNDHHFFWGNWIDDEWCFRILHNKKVIIPRDMLSYRSSITYGGDVTQMINAIIRKPEAIGETYNVVSSSSYSWKELLDLYLKCFAKHGINIKMSYVDNYEEILKYYPSQRYHYERARLLDRVFDNSKICSLMVKYSFTSIEDKIDEWVTQYIHKNPSKIEPCFINSTAYLDRLSNDRTERRFFDSFRSYLKYLGLRYCPGILDLARIFLKIFKK